MKSYQDVVKERYNGREKDIHIYNYQYSLINPVGFYGSQRIREAFYTAFNKLRQSNIDISKQKLLDVGCGDGAHTRFFAELMNSSEIVQGMDLSAVKIEEAKRLNSSIQYTVGDILDLPLNNDTYDIITAIDVFSHLNTENQIITALKGIHKSLGDNGVFLWYDIFAEDHFAVQNTQVESAGYSPAQMEEYSRKCGFRKLFVIPLFKKIGKHHTVYLAKKWPMWLLAIIEKFVPAPPGNIIIVFVKSTSQLTFST